jgi:hypothetical protein
MLTSCEQVERTIDVVTLEEYSNRERCWFEDEGRLEAFMVVAHDGSEGVPWFVSSRCIAKGDLPSYGAATLYLMGFPRVTDPNGLLRKHVAPAMAADNVRTHLPLPEASSQVYLINFRIKPAAQPPHAYQITEIYRAAPTGVTFGALLEMGPADRTALLKKLRDVRPSP